MKRTTRITTVGVGLAISGLLLVSSMPLLAQESQQGQMGHKGMQGMMGKGKSQGMMAEMQQRHEQMRGQMGKGQPMEGSGTGPSGEHEQHHDK